MTNTTTDTAWSALLPQLGRASDPVLLQSLKSEASLLVGANLAPASRSSSISSMNSPAAMSLRQVPSDNTLLAPATTREREYPTLRYQGKFMPRQVLTQ